ncbi:geranylgeranyl hydrogenase BchP [Paractinoplanes abujensis]|uniref:Geranylgeranyl reductase family protein n=1 Tax=Paractinoplanes abujensis TaxID=882441 RepID=A0A7W7CY63_9ACTN|nr:geranylgeranyl reductase family protein [Actinoplanes abujensis]MBB4696792.1 geranylgeranyl reductase family protein [Actinoplanes abujensis]GID18743.1 geranylgeranyl hydrogenase BchP [Actinoplanes abujensis]
MRLFDVAVVGAGPAGAAAALAARREGAGVLLLDKAAFPRDKTCGDGIAAEAVTVLEELGVHGVTDGYPPVDRLRLVAPGGAAVARPLPRAAHTVPRRVFDERLVRAAVAAGAELRQHTVRDIRDDGDAVTVDDRFRARMLIGADGAGSVVRRALGHPANPPGHLAMAIRGYTRTANTTEQVIVTTERRWPAYAWEFPLGDGTANVGYGEVLRGEPLSRTYLLERLDRLLPGLDPPTAVRGHHLPLSTRRPPPAHGRVLLAGDALSLINPFTGEGIFYAVLSGSLAGRAAARNTDYRRALRMRLGRHLRHSGLAALLTRQSRVVDAAVDAAARDAAVFDRMVDLGLGDGVFDLRTIGRIVSRLGHRHVATP